MPDLISMLKPYSVCLILSFINLFHPAVTEVDISFIQTDQILYNEMGYCFKLNKSGMTMEQILMRQLLWALTSVSRLFERIVTWCSGLKGLILLVLLIK